MRRLSAVWAILILGGCQPATHYEKPSQAPAASTEPVAPKNEPTPPDPTLVWMNPRPGTIQPVVPIEFVPETAGAEWANLPKFWNPPPTDAEKAAAALAWVRSRPSPRWP